VSGGSDLGAGTCEVARRSTNPSGGGLARAAVTVDGGNMAGKSEEAAGGCTVIGNNAGNAE
jgi:hypothetical protein